METRFRITRYYKTILLIFTLIIFRYDIIAQITPNEVDSVGFKQGMWREFIIPIQNMGSICFKIPKDSSQCIYLSKNEDRKYFPIVECIGEYEDGFKTGLWVEYYGNGNIKSQIEYKNGIPVGKCQWFWGNGIIKEEFTIGSEDSIIVKVWDENGEFLIKKKVLKTLVIKNIYEE